MKWECQKQMIEKKNGARKIMTIPSEMLSGLCKFSTDDTGKSSANRGQIHKKSSFPFKNPPPVNLRIPAPSQNPSVKQAYLGG